MTRAPALTHSMIAVRQFLWRSAGHALAPGCRLAENWAYEYGTVGTDSRCRRSPLCGQDAGYKGPMLACHAIGLRANRAIISGNRMETLRHEISMLSNDRSVYESNLYFWTAAGAFHQRRKFD